MSRTAAPTGWFTSQWRETSSVFKREQYHNTAAVIHESLLLSARLASSNSCEGKSTLREVLHLPEKLRSCCATFKLLSSVHCCCCAPSPVRVAHTVCLSAVEHDLSKFQFFWGLACPIRSFRFHEHCRARFSKHQRSKRSQLFFPIPGVRANA